MRIPKNIQEALADPEWRKAVKCELRALQKNQTLIVILLAEGKRIVDCKWIFTVKYKADGNIERYKARLVSRGFIQSQGIDYQKTFAPVTKPNTIRVLLLLAVHLDWPLFQPVFGKACLRGRLGEKIGGAKRKRGD